MTEMKEIIIQTIAEPAQITLIKYAKSYGWEISLYGENVHKVAEQITQIDSLYRERYMPNHGSTTEVKT